MALTDIISVNVSVANAALTAAGFGVPLILGDTDAISPDRYRLYTSLSAMLEDGYLVTSPEYLEAVSLLSQAKRPRFFLVGLRTTPVAQVTTVEVVGFGDGNYTITIDGVDYTYAATSDSAADIRDALVALIEGTDLVVNAAAGGGTTLTLTAISDGHAFDVAVVSPADDMTAEVTTANHGAVEDLGDIAEAGAAWYCTIDSSRDDATALEIAAWTESFRPSKIFQPQSNDADAPASAYDSVTPDDLAETLRSLGYRRTGLWWHDDDAECVAASICGAMLPLAPGSESWAIKQLVTVTPTLGVGLYDALAISESQKANLIGAGPGPGGKHANIYYAITDELSITARGTMANGEWIDQVRFVDWLEANIAAKIANLQLNNAKIPFTDQGIAMIASCVHAALQEGQDVGGIASDPKYVVTAPLALDVSAEDRANRVLPAIEFTARLAGAIHEVTISGSVSA